jgi:hypothetical protein
MLSCYTADHFHCSFVINCTLCVRTVQLTYMFRTHKCTCTLMWSVHSHIILMRFLVCYLFFSTHPPSRTHVLIHTLHILTYILSNLHVRTYSLHTCVLTYFQNNASIESPVDLQRALYMNIARCSMKKSPPQTGWCVRMTSLAIGISRMMLLAHPSSPECEEHSAESPLKSANTLNNLQNEESVADERSSSYSAPANEQRSTNVKKDTIFTKIYNFLSIFFPLSTIRTIFGLFFGVLYFCFFGNRVVETREKSEVLSGLTTKTGMNDRNFPDMTGEEVSEEVQLIRKQLRDGYYLRCKALLHACRPQLAKQVCQ